MLDPRRCTKPPEILLSIPTRFMFEVALGGAIFVAMTTHVRCSIFRIINGDVINSSPSRSECNFTLTWLWYFFRPGPSGCYFYLDFVITPSFQNMKFSILLSSCDAFFSVSTLSKVSVHLIMISLTKFLRSTLIRQG